MKKPKLEDTVPGVPVGSFVEEFCTKPQFDEDGVQASSGIKADGKEYPDRTPMAPPVGLQPPEDIMSMIRRMVQHEAFNRIADQEGFDNFEEAGDYDIEDDGDFMDELTPYEALFYPPDEGKAAGEPPKPQPAATGTAPAAAQPPKADSGTSPQTASQTSTST